MDLILVVNQGSSSLKLELFNEKLEIIDTPINLNSLADFPITHFAYRIVHGGNKFFLPLIITMRTLKELKMLSDLAPLHNPPTFALIENLYLRYPKALHIAVFDTAFFYSLPLLAKSYGIDPKYQIERFGFHGIAHSALLANYQGLGHKIITLHLGSGSSLTASYHKQPLDTTMGFTPLEGPMMVTRSGDIDPGAIAWICKKWNKSIDEVINILNFESGIFALSGTKEVKNLLIDSFALQLYCYKIIKYIGSFVAVLEGIDTLIFSGGIGENSSVIRKYIVDHIATFGFYIDESLNNQVQKLHAGESYSIGNKISKEIHVIGSDENRQIAKEAYSASKL